MKALITSIFFSSFVLPGFCQIPAPRPEPGRQGAIVTQQPSSEESPSVVPQAAAQESAQTGQSQKPEAEARGDEGIQPQRSSLEVKPGPPVIKNKDLYEGPGYIHPFGRMPKYILADQKAIWTSPFHSSRRDIKYWAIFGTATGALIATDKWTVKQLPNTSSQVRIGKFGSRIGAAYFLIPITAGFYFAGSAAHNDRFRETGLLSFEALVNATIVETAIKAATQRERPLQGRGNGAFWSGKGSIWNAGFPSGHAINSWALASIWAHQYRHTLVVPIIAYGLASTVLVARIGARRHFPGDALTGAAMGWFIGDYVYGKRHNRMLDEKKGLASKLLGHISIAASFN